ncbi:MAG: Sulfurtransferase TusE [Gammaproteobacteria bacterium]|nr:Sulfurtransferase TusE [Gammaproteobacteria bacterium]
MSLEYKGRTLETDKDGFLQDMSEWSPEIAEHMAALDDLALGEDHWEVINYIREYYEDYRIAPAVRILIKVMGRRLGRDKGGSRYLYRLFPHGPAKQACRYAGLPKPTGCV